MSRREIALGSASSCWAPQWLPDDSGLVLLIIMDKREDVPDLAHLSLRDGSRPIVLTRDDPNEIWSFYVSPDGRSIAYPSELPVSKSSIHVASFKSMLDARR